MDATTKNNKNMPSFKIALSNPIRFRKAFLKNEKQTDVCC